MFCQFRGDDHIVAIHDIALEAFQGAGVRFGDEAAHGIGIVARNLEPDQLRRLADAVDDPETFGRVLANASMWDETVEGGFAKLARGGWLAEEQAGLLVRLVDDPEILERSLSLVGRSARDVWQPERVDTLADLFISARAVNLDPAAMDFLPHTALDTDLFPGFGGYLADDPHLAAHLASMNEAALSGNRNRILGHWFNVLGGYREQRALDHAEDVLGHRRVFSHYTANASVNDPGLDLITRWVDPVTGEVWYFGWETKNSSYSLGALIDEFSPTSRGRVGPGDLDTYFRKDHLDNRLIDAEYLTQTVEDLAERNLLKIDGLDELTSGDIEREILSAMVDNRIGLFFFGGGREVPFTSGVLGLDGRSLPHFGRLDRLVTIRVLTD